MKELLAIQTRLVAPKNQKNNFGNYNYRSLEGIMEAVKPLLKELNCTITFTDDLVMLGDRIFCKSVATIKNGEGETESSTSFAELDNHKGMSKEQSTGSASSYARKYAVCSLLAIDDNADPDMLDNSQDEVHTYHNPANNNKEALIEFCKQAKADGANQEELGKYYKFYEKKLNEGWTGSFNAEALFKKWMEKKRSKSYTAPNYNDMSIQDYEERTLGADDASFYY